MKRCPCCRVVHTPAQWSALTYRGTTDDEDDNGKPIRIEWRDCRCGSTIVVELDQNAPTVR